MGALYSSSGGPFQQLPSLRATARGSGRTATTGTAVVPPPIFAKSAGTTQTPAIKPPSLAKNDLREQCELTVCVRFKFASQQRSRLHNVKQNFLTSRVILDY
jgi:hypothetical protein